MEYHQDRFNDYSLMIFKEETLVAIFPANENNGILYSHQGITYGGLILSEAVKLKDVTIYFKKLLEFYKAQGFSNIVLKQLPAIYAQIPNNELDYLMFIVDATLVRRDSLSVLNMKLRPKVSKDRIAGKKRAEKQELVVKEVDDLSTFWNTILIPNLKAKHNADPVHTLAEIETLKRRFPKNIRQFNVYKNNRIVAGTTIFETEYVAHSQYISGNEDKNTLGSLDLLHHYLIDDVFKDKRYFDFGISNENEGKQINAGLNYWKEGFGARTITQDFYNINLNNSNKLDSIFI